MSDHSLAALGEAIGRQLAKKQRPAGLSLELDHEPIVDAVKAAVAGSAEHTAATIDLAVKAINGALVESFGETSTELRLALNGIAAQVKANGAKVETAHIVKALEGYGQAVTKQAEGLSDMAKAISELAKASRADKVIEYDAQGRIVRVKVI